MQKLHQLDSLLQLHTILRISFKSTLNMVENVQSSQKRPIEALKVCVALQIFLESCIQAMMEA